MVPTSFPSRKISVPKNRHGYIRRERLLDFFRNIGDSDSVLVSAPAGYGKTSLLANWAKECHHPVAWLSLDKGDNEEGHFLQLLIEALHSAVAHQHTSSEFSDFGGRALHLIKKNKTEALNFHKIEKVISCLISEIEMVELGDIWLILDDYHFINNKLIHHGLSYIIKYQPAFLHLAIGTRSDPPIKLNKMRASGQIIEIRPDSLRFTAEEARTYFYESSSLDLGDTEIGHLVERTEGWISALQLAASALQTHQNPSQFIGELSGEFETIAGYLAAEVFSSQPAELRTFLLHTSILDRLSGAICNELTRRSNSQTILQGMRWTNIPIETLDKNQTFYRYQQLFSDMLRQKLRNEDPEKFSELHDRASRWFEAEAQKTGDFDLLVMGIEHAIASGDFERVSALLNQHALQLVYVGLESILIDWIESLPLELSLPSPILAAYRLYALLASGDIPKAEKHISKAAKYFESSSEVFLSSSGSNESDDQSTKQGMLAALRAHVTAHGDDMDRSIEFAEKALRLLPEEDTFWRAISLLALAGAYMMKGDFSTAELLFERTLSLSQDQDSPYLFRVTNMKYLACMNYRGQLARIETIYENTQSQRDSSRFPERLYGGILDSQYSKVLCEYNRLDQALIHAEIGIEKSEQFENYYVLPFSWLAMIEIQHARGEQEEMDEAIVSLERMMDKVALQPWIKNRVFSWKIRSLISQDRLTKAQAMMDQRGSTFPPELDFIEEDINLADARLLLAEKRVAEALDLLNLLRLDALKGGRTRKVIEIYILEAVGLVQGGDLKSALSRLEQALKIAEPFDYLRIFLGEGEQVINLLRKAVEGRIRPKYAKKIIRAYYDTYQQKLSVGDVLINPLSQREWDVLALLEQRKTNDEIAVELVVSTSTVRTHLRSIFRKLDVHRRWDAVARARELNLL